MVVVVAVAVLVVVVVMVVVVVVVVEVVVVVGHLLQQWLQHGHAVTPDVGGNPNDAVEKGTSQLPVSLSRMN